MADYIKAATGGNTFSILTTEYYPTKYRDSTNIAKEEHKNGCTYTALCEVSKALNDNGVDTDSD